MSAQHENTQDETQSSQKETTPRGADERREAVDPAQNPAPRSPEPDQEAVEKGEEVLERIKPY